MEIDITTLFDGTVDTWPLSGSIATHGPNAVQNTWANALDEARSAPLLTTPAELDALRDHMRGYGAWEHEEIDAWDADKCNALFLQLVSGDMRETVLDEIEMDDEAGWSEYEFGVDQGSYSGNIARGWAYGGREALATSAGWVQYCGTWFHPDHPAQDHVNLACDASGLDMGVLPCRAVYYHLGD